MKITKGVVVFRDVYYTFPIAMFLGLLSLIETWFKNDTTDNNLVIDFYGQVPDYWVTRPVNANDDSQQYSQEVVILQSVWKERGNALNQQEMRAITWRVYEIIESDNPQPTIGPQEGEVDTVALWLTDDRFMVMCLGSHFYSSNTENRVH